MSNTTNTPLHTYTPTMIEAATLSDLVRDFGEFVGPPGRFAPSGPYRNKCKAFLKGFQSGMTYHATQKPINHKVLTSGAKFAFKCGGVDYYEPASIDELPPKRYSEWLVKFEEMRMGVDRDFLSKLVEGWAGSLDVEVTEGKSRGSLKLSENSRWLYELRARMQIVPNPNYVYALASVNYFTLDEDITCYDPQKQAEKIKFWEDNHEGLAFFLNKPVKSLMGLSEYSEADLKASLRANLVRWNFLESQLSGTSRTGSTKSTKASEDTPST